MNTEPVAISTIVTVVFAIFGTLLAKYGITEDDANEVAALIGSVISALVVLYSWWKARSKVTPVANPKNDDGVELVPKAA